MIDQLEQWNSSPTAGHETHGQSAVYDQNGKDVAIVYDGADHANLIAAAPDLLAALKSLVGRCGHLDRSPTHDGIENANAMAAARQAIERAQPTKEPQP